MDAALGCAEILRQPAATRPPFPAVVVMLTVRSTPAPCQNSVQDCLATTFRSCAAGRLSSSALETWVAEADERLCALLLAREHHFARCPKLCGLLAGFALALAGTQMVSLLSQRDFRAVQSLPFWTRENKQETQAKFPGATHPPLWIPVTALSISVETIPRTLLE
jgi:hypothetical protein